MLKRCFRNFCEICAAVCWPKFWRNLRRRLLAEILTLSRRRFRANFGHHTAAQISASKRRRRVSPKFRPSHGGAEFHQNFGQHKAAQMFAKISSTTLRRRFSPKFRPANGGADFALKILREMKARNFFFETVTVERGFMTEKVFL